MHKNGINIPINVIYSEVISKLGNYSKWETLKTDSYFKYRRKWKENPANNIVERFPLNLDIEPTNACNLKCPFCYRSIAIENNHYTFKKTGNMPLDLFKSILEQITLDGICMVPAIKLTRRGEPLLCKDIVKMIAMAKDAGVIDVIMNTNATLLTEDLSEQIIDAGVDKILFSFDAPEKEVYEKIRIGADFESTLHNILKFVEIRNKKQAWGTLIRVGMVITEETAPYVEDFKLMFEPIADIISYNRVYKEIVVSDNGNFLDNDNIIHNINEICFACSYLWQRITINCYGNAEIYCESHKQEVQLGNIKEMPIEEIWRGKEIESFRDYHHKGKWQQIQQCSKCSMPHMGKEQQ